MNYCIKQGDSMSDLESYIKKETQIKMMYKKWLMKEKFSNEPYININFHINTLDCIMQVKYIEDIFSLMNNINKIIFEFENASKINSGYLNVLRTFREFMVKHIAKINEVKDSQIATVTIQNSNRKAINNRKEFIQINSSLEKIFLQCKKTAGCWFIVKYIKDIEKNYDNLLDMDFKRNYAKKVFEESKRDCNVSNTMTRINCMMRLVKYNITDYAYEYAVNSNWY